MGTKTEHPDTIDPELQQMIDRYVNDALVETGTAELAHGRFARASIPPPFDFLAPPAVHPAVDLVNELAEAMAAAEIAALPSTREFVDEDPTDRDDDEPTGVFAPPRR